MRQPAIEPPCILGKCPENTTLNSAKIRTGQKPIRIVHQLYVILTHAMLLFSRFQCIANVGLLRTCYGFDDSKGGGEERKRENTSSSGGESSLSFAVENREAKLSEMVRLSSVTDTESTVLPESNSFT